MFLQNVDVQPVYHSSIQVPGRVALVPIHAVTILYVYSMMRNSKSTHCFGVVISDDDDDDDDD